MLEGINHHSLARGKKKYVEAAQQHHTSLAAPGFDPGTYGLWAHRNSSLLCRCGVQEKCETG
jgi:hypothetical protein